MSRSFSFGCAGVTDETLHIGPKLGFQGLKIDAKLCETLHLEPPGRQAKYNRRKGSMPYLRTTNSASAPPTLTMQNAAC